MLGIIALVLAFSPALNWAGLVLAIIAIILGALGISKPLAKSRSTVGLVLGAVALVLAIVFGVVYAPLFANTSSTTTGSSSQQQGGSGSSSKSSSSSTPAPVANAYDTKYGTFTALSQSGSGDTVIPLPSGFVAGVLTAKYTGSDNFVINGLDTNNQSTGDLAVNTIGSYSGTTLLGISTFGSKDTSLQIQASGPWTINVAPISSAPSTVPASGSGDAVFLYNGGASDWAFTNNGQGNFIVNQYAGSDFPGIDINEIGAYSGKDPVDAGPSVVEVLSDGAWTITQ